MPFADVVHRMLHARDSSCEVGARVDVVANDELAAGYGTNVLERDDGRDCPVGHLLITDDRTNGRHLCRSLTTLLDCRFQRGWNLQEAATKRDMAILRTEVTEDWHPVVGHVSRNLSVITGIDPSDRLTSISNSPARFPGYMTASCR